MGLADHDITKKITSPCAHSDNDENLAYQKQHIYCKIENDTIENQIVIKHCLICGQINELYEK